MSRLASVYYQKFIELSNNKAWANVGINIITTFRTYILIIYIGVIISDNIPHHCKVQASRWWWASWPAHSYRVPQVPSSKHLNTWHLLVVVTSCTIWRRLAPRMWTNTGSLNISVVPSVFLILSKFYLLMSSIPIFPMVFSECISHVSVFMLEWKIWTKTPCISSSSLVCYPDWTLSRNWIQLMLRKAQKKGKK